LDIMDMNWFMGIVREEPCNTSIHHSCFYDNHNLFTRYKDDLLKAVLTHLLVHWCFHYFNQECQIFWKAGSYQDTTTYSQVHYAQLICSFCLLTFNILVSQLHLGCPLEGYHLRPLWSKCQTDHHQPLIQSCYHQ
jgi:hypothetical protein